MTTQEFVSTSEEDTHAIAANITKTCGPDTVFLLEGALGSGKTAFFRGIAKHCGVQGGIQSPSFQVVQEYPSAHPPLVHIDAYRLQNKSSDHASIQDIKEYLVRYPQAVIAVEWASYLVNHISFDEFHCIRCTFVYKDEESRIITIETP